MEGGRHLRGGFQLSPLGREAAGMVGFRGLCRLKEGRQAVLGRHLVTCRKCFVDEWHGGKLGGRSWMNEQGCWGGAGPESISARGRLINPRGGSSLKESGLSLAALSHPLLLLIL